MRAVAITLTLAALLAGCASPTPAAPEEDNADGVIDLTGIRGLLLLDTTTGKIQRLSDASTLAWLSPGGARLLWNEANFAVLLDSATAAREVVPSATWVRLYDNATGLELLDGEAAWRDVRATAANGTAPLPPAPLQGARWTQASDDLRVLGAEYAGPTAMPCANEIFLRAQASARSQGCHLRIAPDGRAGWTEGAAVRLRDATGDVQTLAVQNGTREENPIFTAAGHLRLRIHESTTPSLTEVIEQNGTVVAKATGSTRLALQDVSGDGRLVMITAFQRN